MSPQCRQAVQDPLLAKQFCGACNAQKTSQLRQRGTIGATADCDHVPMCERHASAQSTSCSTHIIISGMPAGSCSRRLAVLCDLQTQHRASSYHSVPAGFSNTYVPMPLLQGDLAKLAARVNSHSTTGQDSSLRGPSKEQLYGGLHRTRDAVSCPWPHDLWLCCCGPAAFGCLVEHISLILQWLLRRLLLPLLL